MTETTTVRPVRPGDADAIVRIDRAWTGRSRTEFYARRLATLAERPRTLVAVAAEQGTRLVGFAFARVLDGEFGGSAPVGALDAIAVDAEQERAGVATSLLAGLEAALVAQGARALRTEVDWSEHGMTAFFSASGFRLSPRVVLERSLEPAAVDDEDASEAILVRSMTEQDLQRIVRLDRRVTGRDRSAYLARKAGEALTESAVRVSLVAEVDGQLAGFLMARVDFGEFGRTEPTAVLDTIGVDPGLSRRGVGTALLEQLLRNLGSLRVERVITEVRWNDLPLLGFLGRTGFGPAQRLAFEKEIA